MTRSTLTKFFGLSLFAFLAFAAPTAAQQTISGQVVDAANNQPIAGAQVSVVGSSEGTLSDARGNFSVNVPSGRYSIAIQFIGFETQRIDGVQAGANISISLTSTAIALAPVSVTVNRNRGQRSLAAPAMVNVVDPEMIEKIAAPTPIEYVKGMPGVDVVQTGLTQSNTVARGFNNVFSGALLVLTDNRYARVPSLNLNAYNILATTPLDVQSVEVLLGPAAALYGPNSASGVMHIITKSPFDEQGTTLSMAGGGRRILQGVARQAWANDDQTVGFKVSGQYFRGDDFTYSDPAEQAAAAANPGTVIGQRNTEAERYTVEARMDFRPWDNPDDDIIFTYGLSELINSVEMTGIGAAQAQNWKYQFVQARLRKGSLFAQVFWNGSDAGNTYMLRTGNPIVDESSLFAAQLQYDLTLGDRIDAVVGYDYSKTNPVTGRTITGRNEDIDQTTEMGAYLQTTTRLSDRLDFVAALRADDHEHLEDPVFSPRAAFVFTPADGHTLRATYNRAFSTPGTNGLFLDIVAGRIPILPTVGYNIRASGVGTTGFTFNNTCTGGVNNYCMYSPFAPGTQLPATGTVLWDNVLVPLVLADPTLLATLPLLGLTPQSFAAIIGNPGASDLTSYLLRFNTGDLAFDPEPGTSSVARLQPGITNTYELGYNGLIGGKLRFSASGYVTRINNFTGPLRVETPNVFLDGSSVAAFLVGRLTAVGIPLSVASQLAAGIAATAATVPLGTVATDQQSDSDILMTFRQNTTDDIDFYGADFGFEFHATDRVTLNGSYSHVSEECFDFDGEAGCAGRDIALNAPTDKGSFGVSYDNKVAGTFISGRVRVSGAFPMNSGVYQGDVAGYQVLDLNMGYRVPGYTGFIVSLTLNNALNNLHQEFIGAPFIGRVGMVKLQYSF
ncbi:MAG TPA: hypothetical protein EYM78_03340 [Gemmatimonadetes bacterium]|nr:hypothetical protein [Gemmatimonadota bacterium]HIN49735.1 hypothetical protein [Gemmatimonadota bacterium]